MTEATGEEEVPMEAYYHEFTHQEVLELVVGALVGKSVAWENDARLEDLKGAANQTKIQMFNWAAGQLRTLGEVIAFIPAGEIRERPVGSETAADLPVLFQSDELDAKLEAAYDSGFQDGEASALASLTQEEPDAQAPTEAPAAHADPVSQQGSEPDEPRPDDVAGNDQQRRKGPRARN